MNRDQPPIKESPIENIIIEISGCCNSKCKYCCTGQGKHVTATKFMTADKFEKIILRLKEFGFLSNCSLIELYNWGEPFLNPQINEILCILGKYNLKAGISSNFIKKPDINPNNYQFIGYVAFSLCSLETEKYRRIYGADLEKTLSNFDSFIMEKNNHNKSITAVIHFLKYRFNESESGRARKYFKNKGVNVFKSFYAGINDGHMMINYLKTGNLDGYESANIDLDLKKFHRVLSKCKEEQCFMKKSYIVINESGNLSLCCGVTSQDKEYNLGNILELGKEDIFLLKNAPLCNVCEKLKIPAYSRKQLRRPFYYRFLSRRMIERLKRYKILVAIKRFIYG